MKFFHGEDFLPGCEPLVYELEHGHIYAYTQGCGEQPR